MGKKAKAQTLTIRFGFGDADREVRKKGRVFFKAREKRKRKLCIVTERI